MSYQSKPLIVDVVQYTGVIQDLIDFGATVNEFGDPGIQCEVSTYHGFVFCVNGDYVIRDQADRYDVVPQAWFEELYEEIV